MTREIFFLDTRWRHGSRKDLGKFYENLLCVPTWTVRIIHQTLTVCLPSQDSTWNQWEMGGIQGKRGETSPMEPSLPPLSGYINYAVGCISARYAADCINMHSTAFFQRLHNLCSRPWHAKKEQQRLHFQRLFSSRICSCHMHSRVTTRGGRSSLNFPAKTL